MGRHTGKKAGRRYILHVIALLSSVCLYFFVSECPVVVVDLLRLHFPAVQRTRYGNESWDFGPLSSTSAPPRPSASQQQAVVWLTPRLLCCGMNDYCGVCFHTSAWWDVFLVNSHHCGPTTAFSGTQPFLDLFSAPPKVILLACLRFWIDDGGRSCQSPQELPVRL